MKPRRDDFTSRSCSCTACFYKSHSDQNLVSRPELRQNLVRGSKIDKLYYDKYIPLREKKLLNKLIKPRAVYDDIRHRLISDSNVSANQVADLTPTKVLAKDENKDIGKAKTTNVILQLVDFVKRGGEEPKTVNECCSCCSCDLKLPAQEHKARVHKHTNSRSDIVSVYRRHKDDLHTRTKLRANSQSSIVADERHKKYHRRVVWPHTSSRSSMMSALKRHRDDRRIRKNERHKAKHIKSEPCTCPPDSSQTKDKVIDFKNIRKPSLDPSGVAFEITKVRDGRKLKHAHQMKMKMESGMGESTTVRSSLTKTSGSKRAIETGIRKPIEGLRQSKIKIKRTVTESLRNFIERREKTEVKHNRDLETKELVDLFEHLFGVKLYLKDSLTKYREEKQRQRILQKWARVFKCPKECNPQECFKEIKSTLRKRRSKTHSISYERFGLRKKYTLRNSNTAMEAKKEKITSEPTQKQESGIVKNKMDAGKRNISRISDTGNQAKYKNIAVEVEAKNQKITIKRIHKAEKEKVKDKKTGDNDICDCTGSSEPAKTKTVKSAGNLPSKSQIPLQSGNVQRTQTIPTNPNTKSRRLSAKERAELEYERQKARRHQRMRQIQKRKRSITSSASQTSQSVGKHVKIGYDLERCLCLLKLMPKATRPRMSKTHPRQIKISISKSSQTLILPEPAPRPPLSLPRTEYEFKPMKCNHIECKKRLRKRNLTRFRSVHSNTLTLCLRSNSSTTYKSISSGETTNRPVQKLKRATNKKVQGEKVARDVKEDTPERRAVRISSSFRIGVEFSNSDANFKPQATEILDSNKKETSIIFEDINGYNKDKIKASHQQKIHKTHRPSQISNSRISKSTLHYLRRCFCTLKLVKPKYKYRQVQAFPRGASTSGESLPIMKKKTKTTMKIPTQKKNLQQLKKNSLPYNMCEPGICVPDECEPYECQKNIEKRMCILKRNTHSRNIETENRKTKSAYSFTRKSSKNSKTKGVQSGLIYQKKEGAESKRLTRAKGLSRYSISNSNKQVVKIESKLSFEIKFVNYSSPSPKNSSPSSYKKHSKPKNKVYYQHAKRQISLTDIGSQQIDKSKQKAILAQAKPKDKTAFINSAVKRCFCTLKLHKFGKDKKLRQRSTVSTETMPVKEPMYPKSEMITKGTTIKSKQTLRQLKPYVCVPEKCDPYLCLQRIKERNKLQSKECGICTFKSEMKSISSFSNQTTTRSRYTQAQAYLKDEVRIKKKRQRLAYTASEYNPNTRAEAVQEAMSSSQVVRVVSNFSFSVEFHKDKKELHQGDSNSKPSKSFHNKSCHALKVLKDRAKNLIKLSYKEHESQSIQQNMLNKPSGIRPMLKRCFCTLKLQNKNINQGSCKAITKSRLTEATIMPAQVSYNNSKIAKYGKNEIVQSNKRNQIKCTALNILSSSTNNTELIKSTEFNDLKILPTYLDFNCHQINPFNIRNSLHAMNVQVQHKTEKGHKLKPYECEPGVCVPGQCEPTDCQKRIMKRLMKRASTVTSTKKQSISKSNEMSSPSRSIEQRFQKQVAKSPKVVLHKQQGLQYKTLPKAQKQAVRVGSSFNFNIQFSKTLSSNPEEQIVQRTRGRRKSNVRSTGTSFKQKELKTKMVQGFKIGNRDGFTQSVTLLYDKASSIKPKNKRCFCTLKLQKKGAQQKAIEFNANGEEPFMKVKTADVGQNTKTIKRIHYLDPNECVPYVCVPDECDAYECLGRIKRRNMRRCTKEMGTEVNPLTASVSTMTASIHKSTKRKHVQYSEKDQKTQPIRKLEIIRKPVVKNITQPSRQAIRIGSSFSFDVQFYRGKDRSVINNGSDVPTMSHSYQRRPLERTEKIQKYIHKVESRDKASQDLKACRNQNAQINTAMQHKTTKTRSFLKRCFCTAKLHKQGITEDSISKCSKATKTTGIPKHTDLKTMNRRSQTDKIKETHQRGNKIHKLEPYECEPGDCAPGQCDRYLCAERIKKRIAYLNKMSSKERSDIKSVLTTYKPSRSSKSVSSTIRLPEDKIVHIDPRKNVSESPSKATASSDRNVVQIGSNLSLNMEFYKDSTPCGIYQYAKKEVKKKSNLKTRDRQTGDEKLRSTFTNMEKVADSQNKKLQIDNVKKKHKASRVVPILKRCFCTLALHMPKSKRDKIVNEMVTSPDSKIPNIKDTSNIIRPFKVERFECKPGLCAVNTCNSSKCNKARKTWPRHFDTSTKKIKLNPYECEPGVCVPGQCDPYECKKLIRKRLRAQMQEFCTSTKKHRVKSTITLTKRPTKICDRNVQSTETYQSLPLRKTKTVKSVCPSLNFRHCDNNKQVGRIGSNFSFNIEFYKNKSLCPSPFIRNATRNTKVQEYVNNPDTKSMTERSKLRHCHSQCYKSKTKSKASAINNLLKRCFCTLKLQKQKYENEIKSVPHKSLRNISISTKTMRTKDNSIVYKNNATKPRKKFNHILEPYTCIPGKCDPFEYHERIKKCSKSMRKKTLRQVPMIDRGAYSMYSSPHQKQQQIQMIKKEDKGMRPFLKRCFCTLTFLKTEKLSSHLKSKSPANLNCKLSSSPKFEPSAKNKPPANLKHKHFNTSNQDKSTKAKLKDKKLHKSPRKSPSPYECEPGVCIPGQCDPYKCLQRMRIREIRCKSRTASTQRKSSNASVGTLIHPLVPKSRSRKMQSYYLSKIVEQSRFPQISPKNWQGVKLGSNVSFNIEFYKESIFPTDTPVFGSKDRRRSCRVCTKNKTGNACKIKRKSIKYTGTDNNLKDQRTQAKLVTDNKASAVGKTLKRCFCTAKLHQALIGNTNNRVITVGRIDKFATMSPFKPHCGILCQSKRTSPNKSTKDFNDIKDTQKVIVDARNPKGKNSNKRVRIAINDIKNNMEKDKDVETILPYTPRKFKRNESKTLFRREKKGVHNYCCSVCTCTKEFCLKGKSNKKHTDDAIINSSKRLTTKQEKVELQKPNTSPATKRILHACFSMLSKKRDRNENKQKFKDTKTETQNVNKINQCKTACKKKQTRFPSEDVGINAGDGDKKILCPLCRENLYTPQNKRDEYLVNNVVKTKRKKNKTGKPMVFDANEKKEASNNKNKIPHVIKNISKRRNRQKLIRDCECPEPDKPDTIITIHGQNMKKTITTRPPVNTETTLLMVSGLDVSCEVRNAIGNAGGEGTHCTSVLNRANGNKVNDGSVSHGPLCRCCKCINKAPQGAKLTVKPKSPTLFAKLAGKKENKEAVEPGLKNDKTKQDNKSSSDFFAKLCRKKENKAAVEPTSSEKKTNKKQTGKPCVCESAVCSIFSIISKKRKTRNKNDLTKKSKRKENPCICGSKVCKRESAKTSIRKGENAKDRKAQVKRKEKEKNKHIACECRKYLRKYEADKVKLKKRIAKARKSKKELLKRRKRYKKEDARRRKIRKKKDKQMLKEVKKYSKNTSDIMLLSESLFDIAKLGCTTVKDITRSTFRTATDPKNTYQSLKTVAIDPKMAVPMVKNVIHDSGLVSTLKRVHRRIKAMRCVKRCRGKMEEYPCTSYLLHMTDKNPKKRLKIKSRKKIRRRVPVDFNCSLYMASLRKKPWLSVYYTCPWFYPHCISLLNVWKQFTDIMMFLLAVLVWSPCILAMEACRAMMCCMLCTR